jgi:hypothetical protein
VVVVLASLACAYSVRAVWQGNWLFLFCAVGSAAVVAGLAGQRVFPSDDLKRQLGDQAAGNQTPGPWDAGISIPVIDVKVTPVAVGGFFLALAGTSVVLFLEPADRGRSPRRQRVLPSLDEEDAV